MAENNGKKAVFIDRDGTLIEEVNFLSRLEDLQLFPYTRESIEILREHGYIVVVVTNQSGIGRNIYSEADMHAIHDAIQEQLSDALSGFYFCPHLPDAGCSCRKPSLGMIKAACEDFAIDLENSWMIGDKKLDIETGENAGVKTAMVMTGYGRNHVNELIRQPDIVAENLLEAVRQIVSA
jgi:D-glycero-D-manno-heptose 1,7-bisphosphate phosphatase